MKKLLILLSALVATSVIGATTSTYSTVATSIVVSATPAKVANLTAIGGTNCVLYIYDASSTNLTWVNAAYTNYTTYITNNVTTYVTSTGLTNSFTNSVLYTALSTVAAATNTLSPMYTLFVPANNVVNLDLGAVGSKGVVISNSVPITYSVVTVSP